MDEFLKKFDKVICRLWNMLYEWVCEQTGAEVDEDLYITTIFTS